MKRPLLLVGVPFAGGVLLGGYVSPPPVLLLSSALTLAVMALARSQARPFLLFPLILLAGWTNLVLHTAILSPHDLRRLLSQQPELATIRGTLRETPSLRIYEHEERDSWRSLAQVDVTAMQRKHELARPATGRHSSCLRCIAVT